MAKYEYLPVGHLEVEQKITGKGLQSLTKLHGSYGSKAAIIGDSILNSYHYSEAAQARRIIQRGMINWANALLGWPFDLIRPSGIGGGQLQDIAANVPYYVNDKNPDWVFVNGGANDLGGNQIVQEMKDDWRILLERVSTSGAKIVVINTLPQGDGAATLTAAQMAEIVTVNTWLEGYCDDNNIVYIDGFAEIVDDSGLYAKAGATIDGVHLSDTGAYVIGRAIYNKLKDREDVRARKLGNYPSEDTAPVKPGAAGEKHELVPNNGDANPEMSGTSGNVADTNVSGVCADNWKIEALNDEDSIVGSKEDAESYDIDQTNWQVLTTAGTGTLGTAATFRFSNQTLTAEFTPLDWVEGYAEVVFDTNTISSPFMAQCRFTGGTPTPVDSEFDYAGDAAHTGFVATTGNTAVIRLPPVQIPSGSTTVTYKIELATDAGIVTTFKVRNYKVYRIEPPTRYPLSKGAVVHDMASDANYTLTAEQFGYEIIRITDVTPNLSAGRDIILIDSNAVQQTVVNDTLQILTFKTFNGTGVAVAAGATAIVRCDGTNIVRVTADV